VFAVFAVSVSVFVSVKTSIMNGGVQSEENGQRLYIFLHKKPQFCFCVSHFDRIKGPSTRAILRTNRHTILCTVSCTRWFAI
jgi:hypothetical protein